MIEIDGVRRQLEKPIWESGDYISDEWFRLLDLTTHPDTNSPVVLAGLASAIRRLNRNLTTTSYILSETELAAVYDDVVAQVNDINLQRNVGTLEPLIMGVGFNDASGSFKFAEA